MENRGEHSNFPVDRERKGADGGKGKGGMGVTFSKRQFAFIPAKLLRLILDIRVSRLSAVFLKFSRPADSRSRASRALALCKVEYFAHSFLVLDTIRALY